MLPTIHMRSDESSGEYATLLFCVGDSDCSYLITDAYQRALAMGIYHFTQPEDKLQHVSIKMTFTTPACPMINEMLHDIQSKLDVLSDLDIEVNVVFDPLWTPEMMSNRAKIKLGLI